MDSVQEVVEITVDCGYSERTQIEKVRDGGSERTSHRAQSYAGSSSEEEGGAGMKFSWTGMCHDR